MLDTGANIMKDVEVGRNFRKSLEKRDSKGATARLELLNKAKTQKEESKSEKKVSDKIFRPFKTEKEKDQSSDILQLSQK